MEFDLIKTCLRKFSTNSIVTNSLFLLSKIQEHDDKYSFWNILLLIKWAFLYSDDNLIKANATQQDIHDILILIDDFDYARKVIDFKTMGAKKGMRILAYQQFWHQDYISNTTFDRQLSLYVMIDTSFNIDDKFKKLVGLDITTFINLSYIVFIYFSHKYDTQKEYDGILEIEHFDYAERKFDLKHLETFVNLLSIEGKNGFWETHKMTDEAYQLYETNFLTNKPFVLFNNYKVLPHRSIFNQTVKYYIYNFMKANCEKFPTEFGKRMERYLELGLKEISISYLTEGSLKKKYKLKKVVDFMVEDIVLMECKAVELNPRTAILRTPEILSSDFENSIVKSYKQLLSTAHQIDSSKSWYGIVVTYKDTYVGFGADAWEEFLAKPITEFIESEGISLSILPPSKLCFIDIESWDFLIQAVKEKQGSFTEIIDKALMLNKSENVAEKIMLFEQIFKKHFYVKKIDLAFLNKAHKLISIV